MSTQSGYYTRRAAAERVLAGLTINPKVQRALDMAERYDALSALAGAAASENPPRPMVTRVHRFGQ